MNKRKVKTIHNHKTRASFVRSFIAWSGSYPIYLKTEWKLSNCWNKDQLILPNDIYSLLPIELYVKSVTYITFLNSSIQFLILNLCNFLNEVTET